MCQSLCPHKDVCNGRGLGCESDAPGATGNTSLDELLGAAGEAPSSLDQRWIVDEIRSQGAAPTCVGFGAGHGIQVAGRRQQVAQGLPPNYPIPSALQLFVAAKCKQGTLAANSGTSIQACLDQVAEIGFLPETELAYDPSLRFDRLDLGANQDALVRVGLRFHRVEVLEEYVAKTALAAGLGIVQGLMVDDPFRAWEGGVWPGLKDEAVGGHCMGLLDYPNGLPRFVGSYGPDWADQGLLTTTWDVVRRPAWIIDFVPKG